MNRALFIVCATIVFTVGAVPLVYDLVEWQRAGRSAPTNTRSADFIIAARLSGNYGR